MRYRRAIKAAMLTLAAELDLREANIAVRLANKHHAPVRLDDIVKS